MRYISNDSSAHPTCQEAVLAKSLLSSSPPSCRVVLACSTHYCSTTTPLQLQRVCHWSRSRSVFQPSPVSSGRCVWRRGFVPGLIKLGSAKMQLLSVTYSPSLRRRYSGSRKNPMNHLTGGFLLPFLPKLGPQQRSQWEGNQAEGKFLSHQLCVSSAAKTTTTSRKPTWRPETKSCNFGLIRGSQIVLPGALSVMLGNY